MGQIFISYSRKDLVTTDHIVSLLRNDGFDVWIDRDGIKGGELWRVEIVEAIDKADAFVLMLSPNSVASDNVRKEVDLAEGSKRKLFPLLLAEVTLPPQLRYQLAGIQWIDYASNPEEKIKELVQVLRAHQHGMIVESNKAEITRQAEVVIGGINLASFGTKEQEKLLNFVAEITATPRADLIFTNLSAGSVHATIQMPEQSAYILKTAALNQNKKLLKYGIDAMRLDGEVNYVLIKTGEIAPLKTKPRASFLTRLIRFLFSIIILGILVTAGLAAFPILIKILRPTPTAAETSTIRIVKTQTRKPTVSKPTPTATPTRIPIKEPTKTYTPTPTNTQMAHEPQLLFDFVAQAPFAIWNNCVDKGCDTSTSGTLLSFNSPKPVEDGFVIDEDRSLLYYKSSTLEDGNSAKNFFSTVPKAVSYGGVRGFYDLGNVMIEQGDQFRARVGFIDQAKGTDGVTYQLYFSFTNPDPANAKTNSQYAPLFIDRYVELYDGQVDEWIVKLPDKIFDQHGWFILEVDAGKSPEFDWAVWVDARLERP